MILDTYEKKIKDFFKYCVLYPDHFDAPDYKVLAFCSEFGLRELYKKEEEIMPAVEGRRL